MRKNEYLKPSISVWLLQEEDCIRTSGIPDVSDSSTDSGSSGENSGEQWTPWQPI